MKSLVVRCVGNGDEAIVEITWQRAADQFGLAELVPGSDAMTLRRVNREVLTPDDYPELDDLIDFRVDLSGKWQWKWNIEATEDLAIGYLNRQSEARVKLHEDWAAELTEV